MIIQQQDEQDARGAFTITQDRVPVGELLYRRESPTRIVIDHVEVREDYAGQGLGHQLLAHVVEWARTTGTTLMSDCPFVSRQFSKEPERYRDVLG